jgi:transposase
MAYWLRAGCAWRLLSPRPAAWQTVYHYFSCWRQQGLWEQVHWVLRVQGADPARPATRRGLASSRAVGTVRP